MGPEDSGVVVPLLERQPRNGSHRRLGFAPHPEQRRLSGPCRRRDHDELDARPGLQPLEEPMAYHAMGTRSRGIELGRHQGW